VTPYYEQDGITIYHGDCREMLPIEADAVVTDPPYGMRWNTDNARFSGGAKVRKPHWSRGKAWDSGVRGDTEPFDPTPWLCFRRVVLFGANHFAKHLPVGTTLVWIKRNDAAFGTFLSDAEVAWMKGGHGVYCFRDVSSNGAGANFDKWHPTQKPVSVMSWAMCKAKVERSDVVLDPFMGSGTTLVAAKNLGRRAIGIEIEERYCEIAAKRLSQRVLPLASGGA